MSSSYLIIIPNEKLTSMMVSSAFTLLRTSGAEISLIFADEAKGMRVTNLQHTSVNNVNNVIHISSEDKEDLMIHVEEKELRTDEEDHMIHVEEEELRTDEEDLMIHVEEKELRTDEEDHMKSKPLFGKLNPSHIEMIRLVSGITATALGIDERPKNRILDSIVSILEG